MYATQGSQRSERELRSACTRPQRAGYPPETVTLAECARHDRKLTGTSQTWGCCTPPVTAKVPSLDSSQSGSKSGSHQNSESGSNSTAALVQLLSNRPSARPNDKHAVKASSSRHGQNPMPGPGQQLPAIERARIRVLASSDLSIPLLCQMPAVTDALYEADRWFFTISAYACTAFLRPLENCTGTSIARRGTCVARQPWRCNA